jgi:hypothetical protein
LLSALLHSSQSTAIKLKEYAIQMKMKKEPVKKSALSVLVVSLPTVFSMDAFIFSPLLSYFCTPYQGRLTITVKLLKKIITPVR